MDRPLRNIPPVEGSVYSEPTHEELPPDTVSVIFTAYEISVLRQALRTLMRSPERAGEFRQDVVIWQRLDAIYERWPEAAVKVD